MIAGIELLYFVVGLVEGLIFGVAITLARLRKKHIITKRGVYYFTKSDGESEKK